MAEKKARKHKFIKAAINPAHKGEFRKKAEKAGESTREFAEEKASAPGKLGKQARLAETLMSMNHSKSRGRYAHKAVRRG